MLSIRERSRPVVLLLLWRSAAPRYTVKLGFAQGHE
jgi:hypothetical protein